MLFLVALVSAYLLFFFVSESRQLFKAPISNAKRRRWRFARHAGVIHLVAAVVGIALVQFWSMELTFGVFVYAALSLPAHGVAYCARRWGRLKIKFAKGKAKSKSDSSNSAQDLKGQVKPITKPAIADQYTDGKQTYSKKQRAIGLEPATGTKAPEANSELTEREFVVDEAVNITL